MKKNSSEGGIWGNAFFKASYFVLALLLVISCAEDVNPTYSPVPEQQNPSLTTGATLENFETGTKTSYLEASVTLGSGSWRLGDALIGTSTADHKYGKQALRIINTGAARMDFDIATGANEVHISHAIYGTEGDSKWSLWISTDKGATFTQVGESVTTSSTALAEVVFTVNKAGNVRFAIRRESGSARGVNIDDVEIVAFTGDPGNGGENPTEPDNSHFLFGNPSNAKKDIAEENNYFMDQTYYVMSYSRSRAIPNWVSWHIDTAAVNNKVSRKDEFREDPNLPAGWYRVGEDSYKDSGFDRGHNCPSGDRTSSRPANSSTFLMTNMIPQAPNNNQKAWAGFEEYVRGVVEKKDNYYEAYVIMGNYGVGGSGLVGAASKIDNGQITVPSQVWKVVVLLPQGTNDISRVTTSTRVIAIDIPNNNTIGTDWWTYRTTVDAIETATGYDILSALPDNIETVLEAKVDNGPTN